MVYFTNQLKILHKTLENSQKPIFKKKKQKLDVTSIKTYYKVIVSKTWHWRRNKKSRNRHKCACVCLCVYKNLIFYGKKATDITGEIEEYSINSIETTGSTSEKIKSIYPRLIKDLNAKPKL